REIALIDAPGGSGTDNGDPSGGGSAYCYNVSIIINYPCSGLSSTGTHYHDSACGCKDTPGCSSPFSQYLSDTFCTSNSNSTTAASTYLANNNQSGGGNSNVTITNNNIIISSIIENQVPEGADPLAFKLNLASDSDAYNWLVNTATIDEYNALGSYLEKNIFSQEAKAFAVEIINYWIANTLNSDSETTELFFKALRATNNFQDNLTESFVQDNISYFSQDVQNQILIDPLLAAQIAQEYLIQRAVKKYLHPNWNEVQIYYSVLWDLRHMTLDAFGLIPVIGEVADLANGTLYTIEGDKVNAAFSFASAVPVYGWAAVGVKYAVKIKTVATIGTKVKLTWKVLVDGTIYFGSDNTCRAQLRKVLGLAVGNLNQAHHIIPLNKQTKSIVQKASKSGSAFHMNEALNGIPLSTAVHSGSHFNYDAVIQSKFDLFNTDYPNATPDQCYTFLTSLTQQVRNWIATHPNTPINNIVLP
ncbi:hypothetical protein E0I26_11855, partial [Flavobacterium rhamnosiphilum]